MEVISSEEFKKNYNCDNLKFHNIYDLPKSCKLYYKYLFQLNVNKKQVGKIINRITIDSQFLMFCNCCRYPILDEDSRRVIYDKYVRLNQEIASRIIIYYYRKWKIKNYFSDICSSYLNRVGLFY